MFERICCDFCAMECNKCLVMQIWTIENETLNVFAAFQMLGYCLVLYAKIVSCISESGSAVFFNVETFMVVN